VQTLHSHRASRETTGASFAFGRPRALMLRYAQAGCWKRRICWDPSSGRVPGAPPCIWTFLSSRARAECR